MTGRAPLQSASAILLLISVTVSCSSDSGAGNNTQSNNNNFIPPECGNGVIESNAAGHEDCEGDDLHGETCASLGWEGGALSCSAQCRFDTSGCTGTPPCGNGVVDFGEQCDGGDLAGQTCLNIRDGFYTGGQLGCTRDCVLYDWTCVAGPTCGNGTLDPGEMCDDGAQNSDTQPDACRTICYSAWCGDGVLDSNETCDEGIEISDMHPDACRWDCHWARCGDGVKDSAEACDGDDLGAATCVGLGYAEGALGCNPDCTFNEAGCTS